MNLQRATSNYHVGQCRQSSHVWDKKPTSRSALALNGEQTKGISCQSASVTWKVPQHMKNFLFLPRIAALLIAALSVNTAWAEKPESTGQGKNGTQEYKVTDKNKNKETNNGKKQKYEGGTADVRVSTYFTDPQRLVIRSYYGQQHKKGHCPPGLAKKNNGCMPPGQAKKWALGQPLPSDVVYYPAPSTVVVQLGTPPAGHKYVRVASDILLIAIGTSMIVDAVQDLGRI
jgi:Ni/Co efflux regulator RcnB